MLLIAKSLDSLMAPLAQVVRSSKDIFTDPAIIAVLSASLVAPFIVPQIEKLLQSIPFLKDHPSIGAFTMGLIIFAVIAPIKMPSILRSIIIGISGGFVLTSVLPLYTQMTTARNQ